MPHLIELKWANLTTALLAILCAAVVHRYAWLIDEYHVFAALLIAGSAVQAIGVLLNRAPLRQTGLVLLLIVGAALAATLFSVWWIGAATVAAILCAFTFATLLGEALGRVRAKRRIR
jgi:hypothetical protein